MKVKELLDSPEKWTKEAIARDEFGISTYLECKNAKSFCLLGGIIKCYGYDFAGDIISEIEFNIRKIFNSKLDLIDFNNDLNTTFEDIQKVLEMADV